MYFLARGDCEVYVNDEIGEELFVNILHPGQHFGEVALIYNTLRTATIRAKSYCTIAELT